MKCQHEWRYVPASNIKYGYYTCQKCDADMSETQYEAIQQAHREGWEQGKAEAVGKVEYLYKNSLGSRVLISVAADAISAMEYSPCK